MDVRRSTAALVLLAAVLLTALTAVPAYAQTDFSGEWAPRFWEDQPERVPGPELFDFLGIPVNDSARARAAAWNGSLLTLPQWQCRPHSADYIWRGPSPLWITKQVDPIARDVTAFHVEYLRSTDRTVYLDDRPRPPEDALHTWSGFTKAKWDGDILMTQVTHLKEGYVRRNGLARSDKATVTEAWIKNDDILTVVTIVHDPVYLTEPFIRSTDYDHDPHQQVPPYPCGVVQEIDRDSNAVPHYLPGTNPFATEFAQRHQIPVEATRGGAETMYPDYMEKLRAMPLPPPLPAPAAGARPAR